MWPSAHYKDVGVRIASFRSSIAHPAYSPVYASLTPWRESAQDSVPSGSLVLSRRVSSTPASYRFIPALSVMAIFQQLSLRACDWSRTHLVLPAVYQRTNQVEPSQDE